MLKRHMLVDPSQPSTSTPSKQLCTTNWKLCCLCQTETCETLQCPARSTKRPIGSGYVSLAKDLLQFQDLGYMPNDLNLQRLDDGNGVEASLIAHNALWHKTCRLKYNQTMLQRHSRRSAEEQQSGTPSVHTRSVHRQPKATEPLCFFCNNVAGPEGLHEASTKHLDENVRKCALKLEDTELLAKLAPGDMIATEAKYHRNCLRMFYNRTREAAPKDEDEARLHGIAFAELVAFMEDMRSDGCAPVFKLADLADLYKTRLEQLGATVESRIHTTRLKLRLLSALPDLRAYSKGRDMLLTFTEDIGDAVQKACAHDSDADALHLVRAAQVVRKEMFDTKFTFDGSFHPGCQKEAVPSSLLALVNMIQDGANIKHQTHLLNTPSTTAALTVSQLLFFNSVKHARAEKSSRTVRHSHDRETPLPLYVALKVHAVTRKRELVDTLFHLGMCVSYDRLLQVSSDIANGVCQRFRLEDVVCPPKMYNGLFTTGAVDNIDHNPSSATAKDSFHGTGISLMQHRSHNNPGVDRGVLVINQSTPSTRSVAHLPASYTTVPPAALKTKQFTAPAVQGPVKLSDLKTATTAADDEYKWLKTVIAALDKEELSSDDWISWSAYHANIQQAVIPPPAINALLPLFLDNAHSVAMIRHSMDIVRAAVQYLNPGQVPVLAADQPLYALAKEIQWTWPASHG